MAVGMSRFFYSRRLGRYVTVITALLPLCLTLSCSPLTTTRVERAERLSEEGRFEEAIETYHRHIQERQSVADRPDWENPHFYLLQIADLQLRMSQPDKALQTCREAEKAGVDPALVADRYRTIANWYEERGDMQAAFDILKRYRDRDPLLFEAMLDRVGRALTAAER